MTVSDLLEQPCNKSDNINKMKASCILVDNLGQAVRTLIDGLYVVRLATRCETFACVGGICSCKAKIRRKKLERKKFINSFANQSQPITLLKFCFPFVSLLQVRLVENGLYF